MATDSTHVPIDRDGNCPTAKAIKSEVKQGEHFLYVLVPIGGADISGWDFVKKLGPKTAGDDLPFDPDQGPRRGELKVKARDTGKKTVEEKWVNLYIHNQSAGKTAEIDPMIIIIPK